MLKFEHTEVVGWKHAIRGMRNPLESWEKSDSNIGFGTAFCIDCAYKNQNPCGQNCLDLGTNDLDLMTRLRNAGTDHRKFMRMLVVYVDITGPLYWWKEFDTYKVGTVANSCSTMHCIHKHEFALDDFSHEHLMNAAIVDLGHTIDALNYMRNVYLYGGELCDMHGDWTHFEPKDKEVWWQMIQLLPTSYNQKRTIMMSYEVLANIAREGSRKFHKQDEWRVDFMNWIKSLPYSELITAPVPLKGHEELQNYKEMFEQLKKIMEEKHSVTVCELCNIHDCGDSDEEHCKKCQFYKYSKWANWKKANPVIDEFERKGYTRTVDGNKIVYTKEDDAETNEGLNKHFGGIEE